MTLNMFILLQEGDSAEVIDLDDEDDDMEKSSSDKTKTTEVDGLNNMNVSQKSFGQFSTVTY